VRSPFGDVLRFRAGRKNFTQSEEILWAETRTDKDFPSSSTPLLLLLPLFIPVMLRRVPSTCCSMCVRKTGTEE
jgi:hypothetical protein